MADGSKRLVCAVVGVGPGNGEAFARRFAAEGYAVALIARPGACGQLAGKLPGARAYTCDVADAARPRRLRRHAGRARRGRRARLQRRLGRLGECRGGQGGGLRASWRVNTLGAFLAARQASAP